MTNTDSYEDLEELGTDTRSADSPSLDTHKCPHCSMMAAVEEVITEHIKSQHSSIRVDEGKRK